MRADPSGTTSRARRLAGAVSGELARLARAVQELLVDLDALGLGPAVVHNAPWPAERRRRLHEQDPIPLPQPGAWRFASNPDKLRAFDSWVQEAFRHGVLRVDALGRPWLAKDLDEVTRFGLGRAHDEVRRRRLPRVEVPEFLRGSREQFIVQELKRPEQLQKARLLYTRAFEQLKGLSADVAQRLNTILASGLLRGVGARQLAREMTTSIRDLSRRRALLIARTELVHAHAEGQLDGIAAMGVGKVRLLAEWSTAGDERVCTECRKREGRTYTVSEARGLLPFHPACRCSWIPVEVPGKRRGRSGKGPRNVQNIETAPGAASRTSTALSTKLVSS